MIDECPDCHEIYDRHMNNEVCPKCNPVDALSGILDRMTPETLSKICKDMHMESTEEIYFCEKVRGHTDNHSYTEEWDNDKG